MWYSKYSIQRSKRRIQHIPTTIFVNLLFGFRQKVNIEAHNESQKIKLIKSLISGSGVSGFGFSRSRFYRFCIFSLAFCPQFAFSHLRFYPLSVTVLSLIRDFSSAFYPPFAISYPRAFYPPFAISYPGFIRIFASVFASVRICISVLSLPI